MRVPADDLLKRYERFTPFSEAEAWGVFRVAAIAEAAGWTMLIAGIVISRYLTPGNDIAVQFAGHTHGILFMIYVAAVVVLYPSQGWTRRRTIVAGIASVPPYGSLLFEQWAAYRRQRAHLGRCARVAAYNSLLRTDDGSQV